MISELLAAFIQVYSLTVFAYVIMSWFRPSGAMWQVYHGLGLVSEPYIGLFRRIVPNAGGLDFSPMVALIVLQFVGSLVVRTLAGLGL